MNFEADQNLQMLKQQAEINHLRKSIESMELALGSRLRVDGEWPAMLSKVEKLVAQNDPKPEDQFMTELQELMNRHSKENGSNTQDFVLAQYLVHCLDAFDHATRYRDQVHNIDSNQVNNEREF